MAWNLKQKAQDHIVSIGLGLIVLLLLVVWRAVPSSVWDTVSEAVPKRALWALVALELIAVCFLVGALIDNKRKRKPEIPKTLRFIIFGVHWDNQGNPRCPVCDCLMPIHHREDDGDVLWCPKCKTLFSLWRDNGDRLTLEQGKAGFELFSPPPVSD